MWLFLMWQPNKNAGLYPVCIVFSEHGRSFKSLADTSSGIQATNMLILIHGYCLPAMCILLVNQASVSFWRKCMSYVLLKYEIMKLLLVYNQFFWNPKQISNLFGFSSQAYCAVAFFYFLKLLLQWLYYG